MNWKSKKNRNKNTLRVELFNKSDVWGLKRGVFDDFWYQYVMLKGLLLINAETKTFLFSESMNMTSNGSRKCAFNEYFVR